MTGTQLRQFRTAHKRSRRRLATLLGTRTRGSRARCIEHWEANGPDFRAIPEPMVRLLEHVFKELEQGKNNSPRNAK